MNLAEFIGKEEQELLTLCDELEEFFPKTETGDKVFDRELDYLRKSIKIWRFIF